MKIKFVILMILVSCNFCFAEEFKVRDFKEDLGNILNFSRREVYSLKSTGFKNETDAFKKIKETGDLIVGFQGSEIFISTGEYFVLEKSDFVKLTSIKGIKYTSTTTAVKVSFLVDKIIFIKNVGGGVNCSFVKEQKEDYLLIESLNLKDDWFENNLQVESFKKLLLETKLITLEEQKLIKEKKDSEQRIQDAKLVYGVTTINNYLNDSPSGIKFAKGDKPISLPLVPENGDNNTYYTKVKSLTDILFSFYKLANIRILTDENANSIMLDDFLLKKILIEGVKSSDLPWRVNYHQLKLDSLLGQYMLCSLEGKSIILIKFLDGTENNLKFKWVYRKDGILDFSQLKLETTWAEVFDLIEKKSKSIISHDDFEKIFMFYKSAEDKEKAVKVAIKDGFNINERDKKGDTPIMYLARFATSSDLEILLKNGADPNLFNERGWVVLHSFATRTQLESCKILIKYGAKIDVKSIKEGVTPLQLAIDRNESPELIALLSNKDEFNIFEIIGTNNIEKLEKYIKDKKDLNILKNNRESPLLIAVEAKKTKIVQLILENSEIYWSQKDSRYNPLFSAGRIGDVEILNLFFKNVKIEPNLLHETLWITISSNNLEACKALIGNGAKLDAYVKGLGTPAELIMEKGNPAMLSLLNQNGIQLEFWAVCKLGDIKQVKEMLKSKDLKVCNSKGRSALHFAVLNNNLEVVNLLLESKLLLNEKDTSDFNKSALAHATEAGNFEIVKALVVNKCDINQATSSFLSPISFAVNKEKTEIVKYLLENGANPNLYDKKDYTENPLLERGKQIKNTEIYNLLIKYGAK